MLSFKQLWIDVDDPALDLLFHWIIKTCGWVGQFLQVMIEAIGLSGPGLELDRLLAVDNTTSTAVLGTNQSFT